MFLLHVYCKITIFLWDVHPNKQETKKKRGGGVKDTQRKRATTEQKSKWKTKYQKKKMINLSCTTFTIESSKLNKEKKKNQQIQSDLNHIIHQDDTCVDEDTNDENFESPKNDLLDYDLWS